MTSRTLADGRPVLALVLLTHGPSAPIGRRLAGLDAALDHFRRVGVQLCLKGDVLKELWRHNPSCDVNRINGFTITFAVLHLVALARWRPPMPPLVHTVT